jgi:hypothetical protein
VTAKKAQIVMMMGMVYKLMSSLTDPIMVLMFVLKAQLGEGQDGDSGNEAWSYGGCG